MTTVLGSTRRSRDVTGYSKVLDQSSHSGDDNEFESENVNEVEESEIRQKIKTIPVTYENLYSVLTFSWFQPIIELGQRKVITKDDMFDLPNCLTSKEVLRSFMQCWTLESLKVNLKTSGYASTNNTFKPKLWRVLHTLIMREFWTAGTCRLINDALQLCGTILIKQIITATQNQDIKTALFFATLILISSAVQALLLQQFIHGCFMSGSRVVSATTSIVFHSTLCLRMHKMDPPKTIGEINNVQSKDAASLRDFVVFFHNLWACPLTIFLCVLLLLYLLGFAGLVACILLPALVPLESYIAGKAKIAKKNVVKYSDARMQLINEMIDGVFTVKLTQLCPLMYEKISALRKTELSAAWNGMLIEISNSVLTRAGGLLITLLTFAVYSLIPSSGPLTADRAFSALAVINLLGRPMQVIPKCITMLTDAIVSVNRIESIIFEGEKFDPLLFTIPRYDEGICKDKNKEKEKDDEANDHDGNDDPVPVKESRIVVRNMTAIRMPDVVILKDISFNLTRPGLILILGGNASGKTSLLLSILNELTLKTGSAKILSGNNCSAYQGHDPWIVNATAKENILMAYPSPGNNDIGLEKVPLSNENIREDRYLAAVEDCCLVHDFNVWTDGDETLIGEKGINISGGQRQRISLARALCSDASIFLLDAPMSGLDVVVATHVFSQAIKKASRTRLVVMTDCTYKQSILTQADRIILLEEGRAIFEGTYDELRGSNLAQSLNIANQESSEELFTDVDDTTGPSMTNASPSEIAPKNDLSDDDLKLAILGTSETPQVSVGVVSREASVPAKLMKNKKSDNKLMSNKKSDDISKTARPIDTYLDYARSCGFVNLAAALALSIGAFLMGAIGDYQMAYWTDGIYNSTTFLLLYALTSMSIICCSFGRYYMYARAGISASRTMHSRLLCSILGAPFSFFSSTPSGRITSRFSIDFDVIDFGIPGSITSLLNAILSIITGVGVVVVSSPLYILVIAPLTYKYMQVQGLYRNVAKEMKKIDSAAKSPVHSHFKQTLDGLETIRSYGIEALLLEEHHKLLDTSIRARLNWDFANRWMGIRLDLLGSLVLSAAAFSVALSALYSSSGGRAGLMLSYALKVTQNLTFAIRASAALESMFTSPDRVKEYTDLEQEVPVEDTADPPLHLEVEKLASHYNDLNNGRVVLKVENVVARYAPDLPPALNEISFNLIAGKLVGVCGRTGCGKSTLTLFLARTLKSFKGVLMLNGESYEDIPLATYRRAVQVFPQGSYIFAGRLREFLDPRGVHDDRKLNEVLKELTRALDSSISPSPSFNILPPSTALHPNHSLLPLQEHKLEDVSGGSIQQLNLEVMNTAGGGNLSAGQRQVLALARAALTDADVVLLDEITSNMDGLGAARAIEIVKRELTSRGAAVLLIAHSLTDVAACDEVWVMSEGRIVERGEPDELVKRESGIFNFMSSI